MGLKLEKGRRFSEFCTFGIGGPIAYFVEVKTVEEMVQAFEINLPKIVIGKGSNSLFPDEPFEGLVILNKLQFCHWKETKVDVGSGYSFSLLGAQTARKGLSGLEFASGIPASVGGAIFMNAGANQRECADSLESVLFFDGASQIRFQKEELKFGYRASSFQNMKGVILSAVFSLEKSPLARKKQVEIIHYRKKTQPLQEKSAGCIFRNPTGFSAGALIEECGLKGVRVGGAKVSEMHGNFIINEHHATFYDVKELIELVRRAVFSKTGIYLESEVREINPHVFS